MADIVRVKDPISGAEYDVPRSRLVVCPDLIVLDKPTGQGIKPKLALGTPVPGGKTARKRAAKKTAANKATGRRRAAKKAAAPKEPVAQIPAADQPPADQNDGQSVATEEEK